MRRVRPNLRVNARTPLQWTPFDWIRGNRNVIGLESSLCWSRTQDHTPIAHTAMAERLIVETVPGTPRTQRLAEPNRATIVVARAADRQAWPPAVAAIIMIPMLVIVCRIFVGS
jgi:hypothetical protein